MPGKPSHFSLERLPGMLTVPAVLLIAMWFVPEVLSSPPVFPLHLVDTSTGAALAGLVAMPVSAGLVIALSVTPFPRRVLPFVAFPLGLAAAILPLVGHFSLPVGKPTAVISVLAGVVIGVAALTRLRSRIPGLVVLALPPAALLLVAAVGLVSGAASAAYLSALKTPLCLFAAMFISAISGTAAVRIITGRSRR